MSEYLKNNHLFQTLGTDFIREVLHPSGGNTLEHAVTPDPVVQGTVYVCVCWLWVHSDFSVQFAGVHSFKSYLALGKLFGGSAVDARTIEIFSGTSRSRGYGPWQSGVVAGANVVHTLGCEGQP